MRKKQALDKNNNHLHLSKYRQYLRSEHVFMFLSVVEFHVKRQNNNLRYIRIAFFSQRKQGRRLAHKHTFPVIYSSSYTYTLWKDHLKTSHRENNMHAPLVH